MDQKEYICDINVDIVCDKVIHTNRNYYFLKVLILYWFRDSHIEYLYRPTEDPYQIKFDNIEDMIAFKLMFC